MNEIWGYETETHFNNNNNKIEVGEGNIKYRDMKR